MEQPPPAQLALPPDVVARDDDHLRILSICHYVNAGLTALALPFLLVHYLFLNTMMTMDPAMKTEMAPMMGFFLGFYVLAAVVIIAYLVLNIMVARFLKSPRNRLFCLIVSGINCLSFPLGTTLGVFTIIVMMRPSVTSRLPVPRA